MPIFHLYCFGGANSAAFAAANAAFAYRKIVSIKNLVKIDTGIEACGALGLPIVHDALLALVPFLSIVLLG
jgi:predicted amino acid racemase